MSTLLNLLGVGLEVVGLVVAAIGGLQTWREFGPPGEGLLDPIGRAARAARDASTARVVGWWRRLRRKPRSVLALAGYASGTASMNARLRTRKGYGPLPVETGDAIRMLGERTEELLGRVQDGRDAAEDEIAKVREEIAELSGEVELVSAKQEADTRRVAIGGIRLQMLGFFVVGIGLALQLAASLV